MLANKKLDGFLQNQDSMNKTMDRIRASEKKFSQSRLLLNLSQYFEAHADSGVAAMIPAVKEIMKNEVDSVIDFMVNELVDETHRDEYYTFPVTGHSSDFSQNTILASNDYFDLSLNVVNKLYLDKYKKESHQNLDQRGIGFYGKHQLTFFVDAGGLKVSTWEYPVADEVATDQLDLKSLRCHGTGSVHLNNGDFTYFRPNQTMMFEKSEKNVILLVLEFKQDMFPISFMFSAKDYQLKFQNPTYTVHSRIQLFCTLLRHFDHQPSIQTMKKFLHHELHFVRWHFMQELLGLNALSVMEELKEMAAKDTHSQVRSAAAQTLKMIDEMELSHAC